MADIINLTALGETSRQQLQPLPASKAELPATPVQVVAELSACLTLVAPSGMTNDDRTEWLRVAHMTLGDIPSSLVARGCSHARRTCRFASEIVPSILKEIDTPLGWWAGQRKRELQATQVSARPPQPALPDPEYVDPAEVRKLIQSIGNA